jgi:hypothetical protein
MKRLFLFAGIAAIIGIGIFILQPQRTSEPLTQEPTKNTDTEPKTIEKPTDEDIKAIIPQILGSQFNAATAKYTLANLDQKNGYELIIGALEDVQDPWSRPVSATIQVVALQDSADQYDRIGSVTYTEWMRGVPEIKELKDVTGDTQQEIIASLMYGGASSSAEGILQVNLSAKSMQWLQLKTQENKIQNAIFLLAGSSGHWNTVQFKNLDSNAIEELVEIFAQVDPLQNQKVECEIYAYKWNGSQFVYSINLSNQALSKVTNECQI